MFARLTTLQSSPEKLEDAIRVIENDVIPASKMLAGFKNGYWLTDRKSGKTYALTLFDTEKNLQDSEQVASQIRKTSTEKLGAEIKNVERFEVVAHV